MTMPDVRKCRFCGKLLPNGAMPHRLFCSEKCRRDYQNARRKDERADARDAKNTAFCAMADPWARNDLDADEAEIICAHALLDTLPS